MVSMYYEDYVDVEIPLELDFGPYLPKFYKKGQKGLASDLQSMFTPSTTWKQSFPSKAVKLEKQVKKPVPWKQNSSINTLKNIEKEEAIHYYSFYHKFPQTKLFKEILEVTKADPEFAAEILMYLIKINLRKTVEGALGLILNDANKMDFFPLIFSECPGKGSMTLKKMERAMEIHEALMNVSLKYKYASVKIQEKEEIIHPEQDIEPRRVRSISEMPTLQELALPDDRFYSKYATKELQTLQHYRLKDKRKTFQMLIDVSGSMEGSREIYAVASAISLLQNSIKGNNICHINFFDGRVHTKTITAEDKEGLKRAIKELSDVPFSGGGTSIDEAIKYANEKGMEETILITDGQCSVYEKPENTKMHSILVGGNNQELIDVSNTHEKVDCFK